MDSELAVDEAPPVVAEPSFKGRLQLQDFMYQTSSTNNSTHTPPSSVLRSSRPISVTPSSTMAASHASSRKRKRPTTKTCLLTTSSSSSSVKQEDFEGGGEEEEEKAAITKTPSPRKKRARVPSTYAPPSTYAHLSPLTDILAPGMLILFIGLNPGLQTARTGHAYAHPSNLFWKLLHTSGITPVPCRPEEDRSLAARFGGLGHTNIVSRPSRNGAELSRDEMDRGVAALEAKIRACRPEVACLVGKSIWESVWRVRRGRNLRARQDGFAYGWQAESENMGVVEPTEGGDDGFKGARVFVATSTSGLAATLRPAEKEKIWKELGDWCIARRKERGIEVDQGDGSS